jgi:hypothetical protein
MKNFKCLIPGVATQCMECLSCSHSLSWAYKHMMRLKLLVQEQGIDTWSLPRQGICILTTLNPTVTRYAEKITLFELHRAHNASWHSQTSFDIILYVSRAHKAAWIFEHI